MTAITFIGFFLKDGIIDQRGSLEQKAQAANSGFFIGSLLGIHHRDTMIE
jgi:hypothetical protein